MSKKQLNTFLKATAFLLVLFAISQKEAYSQKSKTTLKVINKENSTVVPYANMQVLPNGEGWCADSLGIIKISVREGLKYYLSAIGYKDTIIESKYLKNNTVIALSNINYSLHEIIIYPHKMKSVRIGMPRFKSDCGQHLLNINQGIVIFMPNKNNYKGYIESISVKLFSKSRWDCPFKLKLMKVDPTFQTAGFALHNEEIIVQPHKSGWLTIDISNKRIAIPKEGFLVCITTYNTGDCYYYIPQTKMTGYGIGVNIYKKDNECTSWWYNPETKKFGPVNNSFNYALRANVKIF